MNAASTKNIRSVIVDDNALNIEILSDLLEKSYQEVTIVGTAKNGAEALEKITSLQPDLVFLDVEMPDMNGFEVLASLKAIDFQTIFVTAHSHYAIQAIRFNALDYLVKPIDPKELSQAFRRFNSKDYGNLNRHQVHLALDNLNKKNFQDQILFLPTQEGGIKMILREIVKVEGERNYSTIYLSNGKTKLSSKTLAYFEEILTGKDFFRCHRSFIINKHHIDKMQKDSFWLKDLTLVPISRRRKAEAKSWFYGI